MRLTLFILLAGLSFGLHAAGKNAYINSKVLLEESPQAKAANAKLVSQFREREQSLRKLLAEIQQMEETFKNDSAIMSEELRKASTGQPTSPLPPSHRPTATKPATRC